MTYFTITSKMQERTTNKDFIDCETPQFQFLKTDSSDIKTPKYKPQKYKLTTTNRPSITDKRATRILELVNKTCGLASSEEFHFDIGKLEKQALRLLQLEDEYRNKSGIAVAHTNYNSYFALIVATCCYL